MEDGGYEWRRMRHDMASMLQEALMALSVASQFAGANRRVYRRWLGWVMLLAVDLHAWPAMGIHVKPVW